MKQIIIDKVDANFAFALEEYIMKSGEIFPDEYFMIWRTPPTLMIGRFQNTVEEINQEYVKENNVNVVRRNSGGGTIYTDKDIWQFTFITWKEESKIKGFQEFTKPVINALKQMGVPAEFTGRNDIIAEGKKFAGNAQFAYKNRHLHHGSILFNTNLDNLVLSLKVDEEKYISKGIKSVRERVTCIKKYIKQDLSSQDFADELTNILDKDFEKFYLNTDDIEAVNKLKNEKFDTWKWNYGNSPKYDFQKSHRFPAGKIEVKLVINKGHIKECKINGDFFSHQDITKFTNNFIGVKHNTDDITKVFATVNSSDYIKNITNDELITCFI